jgi:uncharacterized repeat protein (TIGR03803 family)
MKTLERFVVMTGAAALLTACGGSQSPTGAADTMPHADAIVPTSSFQVLHVFDGTDGAQPEGILIRANGLLYGTTNYGGSYGYGTVFSVKPDGEERVVYSFKAGSDGANPQAGLLAVNGTMYGTTSQGGGSSGCLASYGCGTVFSISRFGEKVLHSFSPGSDGVIPKSSLIDVHGTLYGTTYGGGASKYGAVYSITKSGDEKVVYSFAGGSDGQGPSAGLVNVKGALYGTTSACGGSSCFGTVYGVTTAGSETVIHRFGGCDGGNPLAGLIDVKGKLYGTTSAGGCAGRAAYSSRGTVYSVTTRGAFKVLHDFTAPNDGATPSASLIDVGALFYGTTSAGGAYDSGTIFSMTGSGKEKVLHSFGGGHTGSHPGGALVTGLHGRLKGTLYGTTGFGGSGCSGGGCGVFFAFTP